MRCRYGSSAGALHRKTILGTEGGIPDMDIHKPTRLTGSLRLKFLRRDTLSTAEEQVLEDSVARTRRYEARDTIVASNVELSDSNLLLDGLVCRYQDTADGLRQILAVHVPGDFVDLHSFLLKRLDHSIGALTPVTIAIVPHENLRKITEQHPHLARLLWFSTLVDAAMHREWMVCMGRRPAIAQVAHLFCELFVRLEVVSLASLPVFALPLTQNDLADATGLTPVHVNRMLRELRERRLLSFRSGKVTIHDWSGLSDLAEFDSAYLYLEKRER
jgi:CRP-like cAMP-binding protein